ncbi:MAG TPA: glycoside hydrolase family 3 protein [Ilumatobacteraceae bacterium]|nr:glycoside hydrolase family 3 protein [Ilumatobacteraceae bacterium]
MGSHAERVSVMIGGTAISDVVDSMTLPEKAGQMAQVELGSITPDEVAAWSIGSVLSGGGGNPGDGSARAWRESVDAFVAGSRRSRLGIPILYGTDAVHGHNNVIGATIFPHHIGLGATGDADLVRAVSRAAALETSATGARWTFAPCLAVPHDVRWGRTFEGFSQDTALVGRLGRASVEGWHGDDLRATGVLACAKHFVGEGAMEWGTAGKHRHPWIGWWDGWEPEWKVDQGDVPIDDDELRRTHLAPFIDAIDAGALTVMAGYGSWHGNRMHADHYLLTDVLKTELGFEGFVVSDWMAIDQLDPDYAACVEVAVNAGIDMVMVPFEFERFISTVVDLVSAGRVADARVDDAVARILRVKSRLGLLDELPSPGVPLDLIGCDAHRQLARSAVSASAVVLLDNGALPIPVSTPMLAAGTALDDIGIACGGWTISWEGAAGPITDGSTVIDGLRRRLGPEQVLYHSEADFGGERRPYGVVAIHELPYVEGGGDRADLAVPAEQLDLVRRMRSSVDQLIVLVVSGRPLLIEPILEIADSVVACWLPGSEADGIAEALLGAAPFTGRLPVSWPRSESQVRGEVDAGVAPQPWPVGHGVSITGTRLDLH